MCFLCSSAFLLFFFFFFFFFQAEDGIRDATVTGVQTCALPIFAIAPGLMIVITAVVLNLLGDSVRGALDPKARLRGAARSEERRVGKECRSRWSAYH